MTAKKFIVCSDIHGDMRDEHACASLLKFTEDFNPEIRVINGDLWDFRNLRKGASDDEKAASMIDDWEGGIDFASRFFKDGKENYFLRGNHDERIWDLSKSATGLKRDYANDGIKSINGYVKKWRAKMLPYDAGLGVLELGKLRVIHGYFTGVNAAQAHARVYRNCLFGHTHAIEVGAIASLEPEEARGIGCLCIRDMDYVNKKTGKLRWSQGWAYGFIFDDGSYQLFQARRINGVFYVATKIKKY